MDCGRIHDLILEYFDGTLEAAERLAVEEHARRCAPCREALEAQRVLDEAFGTPAVPSPRPGFEERVLQAVDDEAERPRFAWLPDVLELLGYSAAITAGGVVANGILRLRALEGLAGSGAAPVWMAGAAALAFLVWTELKPRPE